MVICTAHLQTPRVGCPECLVWLNKHEYSAIRATILQYHAVAIWHHSGMQLHKPHSTHPTPRLADIQARLRRFIKTQDQFAKK